MKPDRKGLFLFIGGVLLTACITTLQAYLDILHGSIYFILIAFAGLWILQRYKYLALIGVVGTAGIILGYLYGLEQGTGPLLNRIFSIITLWLGVYFTHRYLNLQQAETKYRDQLNALFENVSEAILFIDREGKIILGNPGAVKLFGYDKKDLFGMQIEHLIPDRFRKGHDKNRISYMADPVIRRIGAGKNIFAVRKDGVEVPVEISLSTYSYHGERFIIAFVTDITKRKEQEAKIAAQYEQMQQCNVRLEEEVKLRTGELVQAFESVKNANEYLTREIEERKQVENQLRKSQLLYNAIASNFPEGIIGVLNRDFRYVFVEGKELNRIGIVSDHKLGEHIFDDVHIAMTKMAEEKLKATFEGNNVTFEFDVNNNYYDVVATPLTENNDVISEILIVIRNITKHKKFEENLLKSLEKEKQLNVLKSRFVSSVSHEFRTPLSTILSSVFLLENYSGGEMETHRTTHHNRIKRSVNSLTELLEDFLSLEKLEEGKIKVIYSEFYIKEFLDELLSEMAIIKKNDQQIILDFTDHDELIMLDKALLTNIISNLVSNAIKYSPPDGVIQVKCQIKNNMLLLGIYDNGMGIPEKEQKFIFKRFFRAQNAINIQGTGLGLNLVKKYVKLMKGTIAFKSRLNEGSSFHVNIPVAITNTILTPNTKEYA